MIYVDTSVWVALLTSEPTTRSVKHWFADTQHNLVSADWTLTEFHSAIAIKIRTGQLTTDQASAVFELFEQLSNDGVNWVAVSRRAFRIAAVLVDAHESGLHTAGALHLAVAQELGINRFATLDTNQGSSAQRLGFALEAL